MTTQQPPMDPREPDEPLPGEAELAALYRRLPQHEPGPALDAAVLRAAAQAVAAPAVRRRRPRWPIALGSAATLVLAAGLGWHMRELPSAVQPAAVAPAASTGEPAKAVAAAPPLDAPPAVEEAAAPPLPEPARPPPPALRSMPAPAPAQKLAAAKRTAAAMESAASRARARAPLPEGQPQAGTAMFRAADTAAPAPGIQAKAAAGAPAAQAHLEQAPSADRAVAAPAMVAPPAPPAPPAPAQDMTETVSAAAAGDTPARELDAIRQLFAQGHVEEARERLHAFHRAHPQWELPAELRAQLREP